MLIVEDGIKVGTHSSLVLRVGVVWHNVVYGDFTPRGSGGKHGAVSLRPGQRGCGVVHGESIVLVKLLRRLVFKCEIPIDA